MEQKNKEQFNVTIHIRVTKSQHKLIRNFIIKNNLIMTSYLRTLIIKEIIKKDNKNDL